MHECLKMSIFQELGENEMPTFCMFFAIVKSTMGGFKRLVMAHLVLIEIYQMPQTKLKSDNI